MAETNGNGAGTWAKVPTTLLLAAIMGLATYAAKANFDGAKAQIQLAAILERMDTRSRLEFSRVHMDHEIIRVNQLNILAEIRSGRDLYNRTGKFGVK
jgi:hypothetical protein